MNMLSELNEVWSHADRNKLAAVFSIIPGAGHLYKHHYVGGLAILTGGNLMMIFVAAWLSFATMGLSLILVPAAYMAVVAARAYYAEDRHGTHHVLHPWRDDEHK